jgi:hypothetical protein
MGSDPEPKQAVLYLDGKCAVNEANAGGSVLSDLLEVQRRMLRIRLK